MTRAGLIVVLVGLSAVVGFGAGPALRLANPVATEPVQGDADDPALWLHPTERTRSLIIATDKSEGPDGALYVFNLEGKTLQRFSGLNRPNNVDVEQGVRLAGTSLDLAVATERRARRLRIFAVQPRSPYLTDVTGKTAVFEGQSGAESEPMGIALYRRSRDGAAFAIVSPKSGPRQGYLAQYRLVPGAGGKVDVRFVRSFGAFSGEGEIEAVAVDDELGFVYYADEQYGIRKYAADPDGPNASRELGVFGRQGYSGDREGIAVVRTGPKTGYILSCEQLPGGSRYHVFPREGRPGKPHEHPELCVLEGEADATDGIEAASGSFGRRLPHGLLIAMNSGSRNFLIFPLPKSLPPR